MPQYLLALQWRLHTCLQYSLVFASQLCALFPWYICWPWKLWLEAKTDCLYLQVVCVCFADCLTVCLLLTVCLSVWWWKRATSTWAVYVGLMASCKEALSQQLFHKDKASASFPRTKMHTPDCRTKEGTERCANPDCEDKRITSRKKSTIHGSIVTIHLLGAAVARRFAREGLTVAVARYLSYVPANIHTLVADFPAVFFHICHGTQIQI